MDMDTTTVTDHHLVGSTKGKRTKRHRPFNSSATSSSSASADDYYYSTSFNSSASTTAAAVDEEEKDMANCLILLAQGGDAPHKEPPTPTTTKNISGFYVYECKTCNKSFPSFQALGGHRASHKKPKVESPQPLEVPPPQVTGFEVEETGEDQLKSTSQISLQLASNKVLIGNKAKIHECSICGSEFTSGQALGGHMRRHRASTNNATATVEVKPRNVLGLDLNLPAPEDDPRDSKFQFTPAPKSLVLPAPALVDCHY